MAGRLDGKRIAILATDGVEEVELTQPRDAVTAEGAQVDVVSLSGRRAAGDEPRPRARLDAFAVDRTAAQASPSDYDALILPGGTVNADRLRMDPDVRSFVREIFQAGKPVGVDLPRPVDADRRRRGRGPDAHLVPEPAHRTCATPAPRWSTRRSSPTRGWCPAATPATCEAFCAKIVEEFAESADRGSDRRATA